MRYLVLILVVVSFVCESDSQMMRRRKKSGSTPVTVRDTVKANNRGATSSGTTELLQSTDFAGYNLAGTYSGAEHQAGFEFQLNVAKDATIDSAYFVYYVQRNYGGANDTIWHSVYDVDNAAVFNAADGHALSSHATAWTGTLVPVWGFLEFDYTTVNIKDLVQHIVNRSGWVSGNYFGILMTRGTTWSSDEFIQAYDYEGGNSTRYPRIVVYAH